MLARAFTRPSHAFTVGAFSNERPATCATLKNGARAKSATESRPATYSLLPSDRSRTAVSASNSAVP